MKTAIRRIPLSALGLFLLAASAPARSSIQWTQTNNIVCAGDGFHTAGGDPWLIGRPAEPVPPENRFLILAVTSSAPARAELRWCGPGESWHAFERTVAFDLSAGLTTRVFDLAADGGTFRAPVEIRFDPSADAGVEFGIADLRFAKPGDLTGVQTAGLLDFRCMTSKRHYEPGGAVPWRATFQARYYPEHSSSKILDIRILDEAGKTVVSAVDHYGILPVSQYKELSGFLNLPKDLAPGRYRLEVVSTDQKSGLVMSAARAFGVIGSDAPFLCETPFKWQTDFSLIRDGQGLWHVFGITGTDTQNGSDWRTDGNSCTFAHSVSTDLRHWIERKPVLSITDRAYPDGNGRYEDWKIWAPHVIFHNGRYYMFYTSVNRSVSQSISLAFSDDLEHWEEYEANPVFTLEGADWALWSRDKWSDCRDPAILRDGGVFYLYATAMAKTENGPGSGAIAVARSSDLIHWSAPEIALRTPPGVPESPQVWRSGGKYRMFTSSWGAGTWSSDDPVRGWKRDNFPRPPVQAMDPYVNSPGGYAEELVQLADGSFVVGSMNGGDTVYISKMRVDSQGRPAGYENPFCLEDLK
jgi:hypothetical protein